MDFFSKIFKHKKILFFACLFLFIFFIGILPNHASAANACMDIQMQCWSACPPSNNVTCENACVNAYNLCARGSTLLAPSADCTITWSGYFESFVAGFADIIEWIPKQISWMIANLADWVMTTVLGWPTTNPGSATTNTGKGAALAFMTGWASNRDLANMLIVLGFIVVAIAFALRLGEYGSKKVLVNLIIVALLVNFSGLFCGLIIDASNLTMHGLISGTSNTANMATDFFYRINTAEGDNLCPNDGDNTINLNFYTSSSIMFGLLYFMLISCFIFLAFMIVVRYAALGILFMLAPLAFFCWVFPATKGVWNKWITAFIKWAFIGVYLCFFLNIVAIMVEGMTVLSTKNTDPSILSLFAYFSICVLTLCVGYYVSLKAAAATAPAVVGAVKTAVGFATGAVVGFAAGGMAGAAKGAMSGAKKGGMGGGAMGGAMAGGAVGATGGTGLAGGAIAGKLAGARDAITGGLEYMGVIKSGRTNLNKQSRLGNKLNEEDRTKRINAMTDEQKVETLKETGGGNSGAIDRALITKNLISQGKGNLIPEAIRETKIREALNNGVKTKDIIPGMESADIAKIYNNPGDNFSKLFTPEAKAEGFKALSKRKDLDLINNTYRPAAISEAVAHGARIEEIESSDYHYAAQNENRRQRIQTANPNFTSTQIDNAAMEQALDERIMSMDHEQLRNVDINHLTASRVGRLTPDKIGAFKYASAESKKAVKDHFDASIDPSTGKYKGELVREADDAYQEYKDATNKVPPDTATANNRLAEYRRLLGLWKVSNNI